MSFSLLGDDQTKPPTTPAEPGHAWKFCEKPHDWVHGEHDRCWCKEYWYHNDTENHEDGEHGGVWMQVRKTNPKLVSAKKKMVKTKAPMNPSHVCVKKKLGV